MARANNNGGATSSTLTHLECSMTGATYDADELHTLSPASDRPLLARYDLERAATMLNRQSLRGRRADLWRYEEVLPIRSRENIVGLGEGWTRLRRTTALGELIGCPDTWVKDEGTNPTGSFKARGMAVAVSRALELGAQELAVPSAGNAAGAMSAYAAAAGLSAHVFMPKDVPQLFLIECSKLGADVTLVEGLINDCGAKVKEGVEAHGWFDCSTLKEPYRLEGKKTMGYELAEQFEWELPDVIIYPTGGGTGLVGMWKAFDEMEQLGLIESKRPKMVAVQSTGCAPIVKAFHDGVEHAPLWEGAATVADGLRVPIAVGDFLMLRALRESGGTAIAVTDEDLVADIRVFGELTGIFAAPEGAACLTAQRQLLAEGFIAPTDRVLLFNTGSGLKYAHLFQS